MKLRLRVGRAEKCEYSVSSGKLPKAFDGFRIAHISDLHSLPAENTFDIIKAENPDITVITGDIFHDDENPTDKVFDLISRLLTISPVYAVTGNHDAWRKDFIDQASALEKAGVQLLSQDFAEISKGGEKITLFGIDDPASKKPCEITKALESGFSQLPKCGGYKILLFHRANLFDEVKDRGFDLILSGHMHGGQIRIPRLGGLLAPSSALFSGKRVVFPKYTAGVFTHNDSTMIINRGLSNTLPLPRWGNRPEVGIITFHSKG